LNELRFSRSAGGLFKLETELWLPRRRQNLFPLFAEAFNLETIRPPWLHFEVLTPASDLLDV
jgi:hypothetical protein